jgi:type I restriction enzyme R subunit
VPSWERGRGFGSVTESLRDHGRRELRQRSASLDDFLSKWKKADRKQAVIGAVVQRALEAAADRLFRESAHAPTSQPISDEVTPAQRRGGCARPAGRIRVGR